MKNLAIIPARGGSKRIPKKNIKCFHGCPIIKYPIEAALASGKFAEVMVSTDDGEIAEIARRYGASVPFMRSPETAHDLASTEAVIDEVIRRYGDSGQRFECFCCIYPTAPFLTAEKLSASYDLLMSSGANSVISVVKYSYPIQRALVVDSGRLAMLSEEYREARSQELRQTYHDAGQFYWCKTKAFIGEKQLFMRDSVAYEVPETEAQDIDNEIDWRLAEIKFAFGQGQNDV
jgi:pseudaminic acid cytidylyltransferase